MTEVPGTRRELRDFSLFVNDQEGAKPGVSDGQTTCFPGSQEKGEQGARAGREEKLVELEEAWFWGQPRRRGLTSEPGCWTGSQTKDTLKSASVFRFSN